MPVSMKEVIVPTLGGILIGTGSLLALAASGKIPGISGIVSRAMRGQKGDTLWRVVFILGLMAGAVLVSLTGFGWQAYSIPVGRTELAFVLAGLLVGVGTRVGGGCTSGHGVCGIGAGAKDGLVYTLVFMVAGAVTVLLWRWATIGGVAG